MDIRTLTPTICRLMQVEPPQFSITQVQENLLSAIKQDGIDRIEKCLIFAPDAIGKTIHEKYPEYFSDINQIINHTEYLQSIYPPKTPVCFASMFSGTLPKKHGIQAYARPVLKIDTIFDALLRSNKKVAIVAVQNQSIDLIFRNRKIDYYSEIYDNEVIEKALSILSQYDFIVVYNQEYDDCLHKTEPYSKECLNALAHHNQAYIKLVQKIRSVWKASNWLAVYGPDHGAHYDETKGIGNHGENIPEDMDLLHHYTYSPVQ